MCKSRPAMPLCPLLPTPDSHHSLPHGGLMVGRRLSLVAPHCGLGEMVLLETPN